MLQPPLQNNDNLLSIMCNRLTSTPPHLSFNLLSGPLEMEGTIQYLYITEKDSFGLNSS